MIEEEEEEREKEKKRRERMEKAREMIKSKNLEKKKNEEEGEEEGEEEKKRRERMEKAREMIKLKNLEKKKKKNEEGEEGEEEGGGNDERVKTSFVIAANPRLMSTSARTVGSERWKKKSERNFENESNDETDVKVIDKENDTEIDPLDAFMQNEIRPEIALKEKGERERFEREREELMKLDCNKRQKMIDKLVNDSDDEDCDEQKPVEVISIPTKMVKLLIGAQGENIKRLQRQSGCRAQIRKKTKALYEGFSGQKVVLIDGDDDDGDEKNDEKTMIELYGDIESAKKFKTLIEEMFALAKSKKTESRRNDRERQQEKKHREKRMFHLRHAADYERLGVPLGAPKKDIEKAYRKQMLLLHPDKHLTKSNEERLEMNKQYENMRTSYDKLMNVDEDNIQETKSLAKKSHADVLEELVPKEEEEEEQRRQLEEIKRNVVLARAKILFNENNV